MNLKNRIMNKVTQVVIAALAKPLAAPELDLATMLMLKVMVSGGPPGLQLVVKVRDQRKPPDILLEWRWNSPDGPTLWVQQIYGLTLSDAQLSSMVSSAADRLEAITGFHFAWSVLDNAEALARVSYS